MAGSMATVVRKIMFAHIAEDGKTPVFNASTKKWEFKVKPTDQQLAASAERLQDIEGNAAAALDQVESKASMADVKGLFPISGTTSPEVVTRVNFQKSESDGWCIFLCTAPANNPDRGSCSYLGYPTKSQFEALKARVAALEKKLGLS